MSRGLGDVYKRQIQSWYPLKVSRPIVLVNKDAELKQVVKKMENPYNNPDYAILRYLVKNYVKMREEFLPGSLDLLQIDHRVKKISNNSTREISKEYQRIFDNNNFSNPLIRLGRSGFARVRFQDINLDIKKPSFWDQVRGGKQLMQMPKAASVTYQVQERSAQKTRIENWKVIMNFNYAGVIIDKENNSLTLTDFTVTDYKKRKMN